MTDFGASFSAKYARRLGIDPKQCLSAALKDLGVKRLRLMSYWDEHEAMQGHYDFRELDWQFALAEQYGAQISLAIGLRQPRWPESHWPSWAKELPKEQWLPALFMYLQTVVERYKDHPALESWQLENEALLKTFGEHGDFDRRRLKKELKLVKRLDATHPVIMSTSDSWGFPWRGPRPDMYAFSIYRYIYSHGQYHHDQRGPKFYRRRARIIRLLTGRRTFIHEFQAEPWGPTGTPYISVDEQFKSMSLEHLQEAFAFAKELRLYPTYFWGLEWWYWLKVTKKHPEFWNEARKLYTSNRYRNLIKQLIYTTISLFR